MRLADITAMLLIVCILGSTINGYTKEMNEKMPLPPAVVKFGTIPVLQSLPLFVAAEKGFFKEQGLHVEIILFNSAMEKDIALSSGQIAGYFGDIMTPLVLQSNGVGAKIVAANFNTTKKQRMFAILTSPQSKNKSLEEVAREGIAAGSNAIPEYLVVRLLQSQKINKKNIKLIDVKSIPIRLQMLMSNQVSAALLPEPLATLAEKKGAKALIDDKAQGLSTTVLVFSDKYLRKHPQAIKSFHAALGKAADYINKNPREVRAIMNRECRVPEPLQGNFPIPAFPQLTIPSERQVMDVYDWLREKQIIKKEMTYKEMISDGYLP
ncbi:MAG: ABC transporter substrate-binding protein [Smithellaceae bacterium]